jgi:hypothetical protein
VVRAFAKVFPSENGILEDSDFSRSDRGEFEVVPLERTDQLSETDGITRYPVSSGKSEGQVQLCNGYFPNFTSRGFHMDIFSNQHGAIFPLLETFNKSKCSFDLSAHAWDVQIHRISMILRRFTTFNPT